MCTSSGNFCWRKCIDSELSVKMSIKTFTSWKVWYFSDLPILLQFALQQNQSVGGKYTHDILSWPTREQLSASEFISECLSKVFPGIFPNGKEWLRNLNTWTESFIQDLLPTIDDSQWTLSVHHIFSFVYSNILDNHQLLTQ